MSVHSSMSSGTCIDTTAETQNSSIAPKLPQLLLYRHTLPLPYPLATTDLLSIAIVLSFWECHKNGTVQCVTFWDWLLSLSTRILRFMQSAACTIVCSFYPSGVEHTSTESIENGYVLSCSFYHLHFLFHGYQWNCLSHRCPDSSKPTS